MENPIKMDDLGVPFFLETPIWSHPLFFEAANSLVRRLQVIWRREALETELHRLGNPPKSLTSEQVQKRGPKKWLFFFWGGIIRPRYMYI